MDLTVRLGVGEIMVCDLCGNARTEGDHMHIVPDHPVNQVWCEKCYDKPREGKDDVRQLSTAGT